MTQRLPQHQREQATRLYETYAPGVFATCLAMLGDREDAADATQEVFARALPALDRVEHPCAWLQTAARHHCSDLVRRRQMARRRGVPSWGRDRSHPDPAEVVALRLVVASAVAAMTEKERHVIAHAVLRDLSVSEIAARMRLSYAAAVKLLSRARQRAVQVAQLPSTVVAPRLDHLAGFVRRVTQSAPAAPRGVATGGMLALCAGTLLCGGGGGAAVLPRVAMVHPGAPVVPVPSVPGVSPLPAPDAVSRSVALARRAVRRVAAPALRSAPSTPPCSSDRSPGQFKDVWTDSTGDAGSGTATDPALPQLDLTRGSVAVDGGTLHVRMYVQSPSASVPPGAQEIYWTTELTPTVWVYATATALGGLAYADQWWPPAGQMVTHADDTGRMVSAPGGYLEVDVPLAHLGLQPGQVLHGVTAVATVDSIPQYKEVDRADGDGDFTMPPC